MLIQSVPNREAEKARVAAFNTPMNWIPLTVRYPAPDEHVLVKMDDGSVEIGYWDNARAGWSHSPFERWGVPEAWVPIPPPRRGL